MKHIPIYLALCVVLSIHGRAQYLLVNQAMTLTGSGYVSVPYAGAFNADLNQTGMLSIDAWVNPTVLSGYQTIVGNDYVTGYYLGITPSGQVRFYPRGGTLYDSPGTIAANTWTHVGVSFNARKGDVRVYINGVLNGSTTIASGGVGYVTSGDLRIGADRQSGSPAYYFTGRIDEVRIWNAEINFSSAAGLLYKVPHAVYNGLHGADLAAGWRLNGNADGIDGQYGGSASGSGVSFSGTSLPPHYTRIGALLTNVQPLTAAGTQDYFTIPHDASVSLLQNYTLECWVKPSSTNGSTSYQTFISKSSIYMNQWTYWLGLNKSTGKVRFVPNGDFADGLESTPTLTTGVWTHVAARYTVSGNSRIAQIFINGAPAGSKSYSRNATANQLPVLIGRSDASAMPGNGYGYSGVIDEVRIWNSARSDDEIANNHRLELSGSVAGLVASYHFDGDVLDASGTGNDGFHTLAPSSIAYFLDASDLPPRPTITVIAANGGETWTIGSMRTIQWSASNLSKVKIELSRDNGATYAEVLTPSVNASPGSLNWVVTGPETDNARIRVTTTTSTSVADESNTSFRIIQPPPVLLVSPSSLVFAAPQAGAAPPPQKLYISNTGGGTLNWTADVGITPWIAVSPTAGSSNTDSLEVTITDTNLPEGSYNATITFGGNASNIPVSVPVTYRVTKKQIVSISGRVLSPAGAPLAGVEIGVFGSISASSSTDGTGFYIVPGLPADSYNVIPSSPFYDFAPPTRSYPSLTGDVTDANFTATAKRGKVMLRWREGWNLVSFPVIPDITDLKLLLPACELPAYLYSAAKGYEETSTVQFGRMEMWIKFKGSDSAEVQGLLLPAVQKIVSAADGGWHLIGVPSGPVDVSAMTQSPSGIIGQMYEYDPWLGYIPPVGGVLRPGRAYFMRAMGDGSVRVAAIRLFSPWVPLPTLRYPSADVLRDYPPAPPRE